MKADRSGAERLQQADDTPGPVWPPGRFCVGQCALSAHRSPTFTCVCSFAARAKSVDG